MKSQTYNDYYFQIYDFNTESISYPMAREALISMLLSCRDKTTINFQFIYHIAFWLLDNSTTLRGPKQMPD